jgi:DNA-binding response OmpR family regulator
MATGTGMAVSPTGNLNLSRVRVLIVDDNEFAREFITAALNSLNIREIVKAEHGAQALELIKSHMPDLVLIDWMMEPVNGLELIRELRAHPNRSLRFMPIIMVSAYSELWRVHNVRDAGANEFVVKPFSAKTLYAKIRAIVDNPRPFIEVPRGYFGPDRRRRTVPVADNKRQAKALSE